MKKLLEEQQITKKVTLVGAVCDAILGIAKIVAGYFSQSQALIADGIHSLSDLLTDAFVLVATSQARQAPDENHPYGHLRYETLATVLLGMVLIVVAAGIAFESFTNTSQATVTWYGIASLILTIVVKEGVFHYTKRAGEKIQSRLLIANAWHSRTDALSSIAVLIGLGGVFWGYQWADTLASIIVAALIAKIAFSMIWENVSELVDTAPDPAVINNIRNTVDSLQNIMAPHDMRARSMAGKIYLDLHIHVPAHASVSEGHYLSDLVVYTIKKAHPQVQDVLVHVDTDDRVQNTDSLPQEGLTKPAQLNMPARDQILADLGFVLRLHRDYIDLNKTQLHYLDNSLTIVIHALADKIDSSHQEMKTNGLKMDLSTLPYGQHHSVAWSYSDV
ncbi:cation diffusion facilitator family transporter [Marinomonas mediterranea]|uniref:Cation diffusion facilitator family transporter n=1 Tax=Marinomonas mediterranea (strain ATCC 700492 / JCM 21426 / NBRC 103028 / MMB-1) TaxID=717774 RepID=F2K1K6_MARM1|nr:cation diffusion facilitator family transporter [Marinomonas mediterranea]ADZ92236.1 cation diffusion facilitator family transporter [Marinomonas mediterranea MMB-1]WCN18294.1 cation diffusion facilitator family transporter [Marinomonas mediterranea MMB-1]